MEIVHTLLYAAEIEMLSVKAVFKKSDRLENSFKEFHARRFYITLRNHVSLSIELMPGAQFDEKINRNFC